MADWDPIHSEPDPKAWLPVAHSVPGSDAVDMGDQSAAPSYGENVARGAFSPIDAVETLLKHQVGASGGSLARIVTNLFNKPVGQNPDGSQKMAFDPDKVHDAVFKALGGEDTAVTSQGQSMVDAPGNAANAVGNAALNTDPGKAVSDAVGKLALTHPKTASMLAHMGTGATDIVNTLGLVTGGEGATAESQAAAKSAQLPASPIVDPIEQLKTAGYKIPETSEDLEAARQNNPQITAELAKRAAGISPDRELSNGTLNTAKVPHNNTYDQIYGALPDQVPAGSDPAFQSDVASAGSTPGTLTPKNDAVDALKQQALANDTLTPQQIKANISNMREAGFRNKNNGADDATRALGQTQLDIANAHEGLIDRNLPPTSPVSLDDLQDARTSLAKINMVQRHLVGEDVNPATLANEARGNNAVNGELRLIANLHDLAPKGAQLPQRAVIPRTGLVGAVTQAGAGALAGHMVGGIHGAAIGAALGAHDLVPAMKDAFSKLGVRNNTVPEDLTKAGLGDLFTRGNGLEPGWNRTQQLELSPSPGGPPIEPMQRDLGSLPQGPGPNPDLHLTAPPSEAPVVEPHQPDLAFGAEPPNPNGTLPPGARVGGPTTVASPPGGLSLADSIIGHGPSNMSDLGHVMSQGVPEGIMSRTAPAGNPPLSLDPSQAQGRGFTVNPLSHEPTLAERLEGADPNAGHQLPSDLPEGKAISTTAHRGVPMGVDADAPGHEGAQFLTPDKDTAQGYAGPNGDVVTRKVNFKNALDVGSLPQTIASLGLSPHSDIGAVIKAARSAGYDGMRYTLGGAKNDTEIVDLKPKGKS